MLWSATAPGAVSTEANVPVEITFQAAQPHAEPFKEIQLDVARHSIDMLAMLQEKTKGNLTSEEDEMLESALHQMRMLFVAVQNQATSSPS